MTKKGVGEEEKANSEYPMIWKLTQECGKDKEMLKSMHRFLSYRKNIAERFHRHYYTNSALKMRILLSYTKIKL